MLKENNCAQKYEKISPKFFVQHCGQGNSSTGPKSAHSHILFKKKWLPARLLYNDFVSDRVMKIISCSNFGSATNAFIRNCTFVEFQDKNSKPKLVSQLVKQNKVFNCFNTSKDFQLLYFIKRCPMQSWLFKS